MKLAGTPALDRLLFSVLKVRYDARRKGVGDRIDTLAEWSGMGYRAVQRALDRLRKAGLIERDRRGVTGGSRGAATVTWTTKLRPYEDWPTGPLERLIAQTVAALTAYRAVFLCNGRASQASPSTTDTPAATEGHVWSAGRTRLATRDNQASYPEIYPERGRSPRVDEDEGTDAAFLDRLSRRWKRDRVAAGYDRFVDARALADLRQIGLELLTNGADRGDVERAVTQRAAERWSDTRELAEWVTGIRTAREEAEEALRRSRAFLDERAREDRELEERLARERADPNYPARLAAIRAVGARSRAAGLPDAAGRSYARPRGTEA